MMPTLRRLVLIPLNIQCGNKCVDNRGLHPNIETTLCFPGWKTCLEKEQLWFRPAQP